MPQPSQALPYRWVVHSTPLREISIITASPQDILRVEFGTRKGVEDYLRRLVVSGELLVTQNAVCNWGGHDI